MTTPLRALLLITLLLFQSHWLDDAGTGAADTAGVVVSLIGSIPIVIALIAGGNRAAKALLALGLAFIAFISVADLAGLQPDGSRAPDLLQHWSAGLGWLLTMVVGATLVAAIGVLIQMRRRA